MKNNSPPVFFIALAVLFLITAGCTSQHPKETAANIPLPVAVLNTTPEQTVSPEPITTFFTGFPEPNENTPTVVKGDDYKITIKVINLTSSQIIIWVFNDDSVRSSIVPVGTDGSFASEIPGVFTGYMKNGPIFIVIQYPGNNRRFDILPINNSRMINQAYGFQTQLSGQTQKISPWCNKTPCIAGYTAANSLLKALDSPTIDDDYSTDLLLVEDPWIQIDPIGTILTGEQFTINGTTNLAPGDILLVEVLPKWYIPTQCGCGAISPYLEMMLDKSGMTSGVITVEKGRGRINTWSFHTPGKTLGPDEFRVNVDAILQIASNQTIFRVKD